MGFLCCYHSLEVLHVKPKIVIDISNVARYYNESPPKMENIKIMFQTLKSEYWVIGIADWNLQYCINNPEFYSSYLKRGIITQTPPKIEADILIIMIAIAHDCFMITNDKFRDHIDLIPSELWLQEHLRKFEIINGEFQFYQS